jgi:hypothetical protein
MPTAIEHLWFNVWGRLRAVLRQNVLQLGLVTQILPVSPRWHQVQQGMRYKSGARDFTRSLSPPPSTPTTTMNVFADDDEIRHATVGVQTAESAASKDHDRACSGHLGTASSTSPIASYPTDSHVEAKKRRELREEGKTPEQIKEMRRKKPQI